MRLGLEGELRVMLARDIRRLFDCVPPSRGVFFC